MAGLSGWAKGIKITVDSGDIDSALSNFPTLIYLSASSGYNNVDVSCVFDELESNDNRKKIAVTTSDGETQCYVEIGKWDHDSEKAWLWVKIPNIASDTDTEIWIYYDKTKADNTSYVGDPSDAVVHNVWDSNFKLVTHMKDDPDTSHIRDSTVNANDGTKRAANEPIEIDGKIDDAQDFDGIDDIITVANDNSLKVSDVLVELWIYPDNPGYTHDTLLGFGDGGDYEYYLTLGVNNNLKLSGWIGTGPWLPGTNNIVQGVWSYVVMTFDSVADEVKFYINGSWDATVAEPGPLPGDTVRPLYIGNRSDYASYEFDGRIDEARVSSITDITIIPAWIKASYESGRDHLLDFGSEEFAVSQAISGTLTFTGTITTVVKRLFRQAEISIVDNQSEVSVSVNQSEVSIVDNQSELNITNNGSNLSVSVNQSELSTKENDSVLDIDANQSVLSIKR